MSESERILLEWLCLDHGGEEAEKIVEIAERAHAEGYRQALEAAAKVADSYAVAIGDCEDRVLAQKVRTAKCIAAAIRAEMEKKP